MKKFLSFVIILTLLFSINNFTKANTNQLIKYPEYPDYLPRNYDYSVSVTQGNNAINIPVYNGVLQKDIYFNDAYRRFCEFGFSGEEVTINITVNIDMTSFEVLPSSKKIPATVSNNIISIKLKKADNIILRLNDNQDTVLSIFAESPETSVPSKSDKNVIYCDSGLNNITNGKIINGEITVNEGETLYLAPGALVQARVIISGNNTSVIGRGALIDPEKNRNKNAEESSYFLHTNILVNNLNISGIKLLDARTFNVALNVSNSTIDNLKILSNQISTDGISYWTVENKVVTKDCFLYVNDNALVLGNYLNHNENCNMIFDNITIGTSYAAFFPQGGCNNINFNNINIFKAARLFKATVPLTSNNPQNINFNNIYATDIMNLDFFIYCADQKESIKKISFENVALPENVRRLIEIDDTLNDYETKNYTFNFKNVWQGKTKITSMPYSYNTVVYNFNNEFNSDTALPGITSKQTALYSQQKIYIGKYLLPSFKNQSKIINNTLYIDAISLLKELNFDVEFNNKALTFKNKNNSYLINQDNLYGFKNSFKKILSQPFIYINGALFMPINALTELEITNYSFDKDTNTLFINNVDSNKNFLSNGDFEKGCTLDWICYMFSNLYEKEGINSVGKSLYITPSKDYLSEGNGVYQYVFDKLLKGGQGKYHFEAYVKLDTSSDYNDNTITMGLADGNWGSYPCDYGIFQIDENWQKISYDVEINDEWISKYTNAFFFIAAKKGSYKSFYIDNVSMTKTEPDNPLEVDVSMTNGASIRLNEKSGIRFYTNVDKDKILNLKSDNATVEMGTLIAPVDLLDGEELTLETPKDKMVNVIFQSDEYYTEDEFEGIVGSLVNIKQTTFDNSVSGNITRDFVGRGYVKVTKGNETYISYADYNNSNSRSLAFVANELKNDLSRQSLYNKNKLLVDKWASFLNS